MTSSDNIINFSKKITKISEFCEITITKAKKFDSTEVTELFRRFKEVSFCEWQDAKHISSLISSESAHCYIAKDSNDLVVGAVIGGIMGTRATLNHIAIDEQYQKRNIGTMLTEAILADFDHKGVKRVFLFIEDNNSKARDFWFSQGFKPTNGETTCERDL
jgi:ribosomal protein S18 acetylase RimI-like enzyme